MIEKIILYVKQRIFLCKTRESETSCMKDKNEKKNGAKTVKIYSPIWHMKRYGGKIYRVILVQGPKRWADRVVL